MTTTIKNSKTGEIFQLTIIDPKSNLDWSGDFIGNQPHDLQSGNDTEYETDDQEKIDWWIEQAAAYEKANHRLYDAKMESGLDPYEIESICSDYINCEFNDLPEAMNLAAEHLENAITQELMLKNLAKLTDDELVTALEKMHEYNCEKKTHFVISDDGTPSFTIYRTTMMGNHENGEYAVEIPYRNIDYDIFCDDDTWGSLAPEFNADKIRAELKYLINTCFVDPTDARMGY